MPEAKRVCVLICGSAEGAEPKAKTDESLQRKTDLFFFHPVQTFRQYNAETYHFFPPPLKRLQSIRIHSGCLNSLATL